MPAACGHRASGTADARLKKIVVPGSEPFSGRPSYPRRLRSKFGFGLIKAVRGEG
jgi:hypothetical protein